MGLRTHCPRGHEYTPENTDVAKNGMRKCRICKEILRQPRIAEFLSSTVIGNRDECWEWAGTMGSGGYGHFSIGGKRMTAHKAAYILFVGPWPEDRDENGRILVARHTCDVKLCVNPEHIIPGTQKENIADMVSRGRHRGQLRTHCPQGHPLEEGNLRIKKFEERGIRECLTCHRETSKIQQQKIRDAKRSNSTASSSEEGSG